MSSDIINWDGTAAPYSATWPATGPITAAALEKLLEWIWRYSDTYDPPPYPSAPALITDEWLTDRAAEIDDIRTAFSLPAWTWQYQTDVLITQRRLTELRRALPRVASHGIQAPYTDLSAWARTVSRSGASWPYGTYAISHGSGRSAGVYLTVKTQYRSVYAFSGLYAPLADACRLILHATYYGSGTMTGRTLNVHLLTPDEPSLDDTPAEAEALWDEIDVSPVVGTLTFDATADEQTLSCDIADIDNEDPFALAIVDSTDTTEPTGNYLAVLSAELLHWSLTA
jgi:hypothetical protein